MVYRRMLDQVPSLVVGGASRIGQHQGDRLGQIHGAAAPDADDTGRQAVPGLLADLFHELVHVGGLGLVVHIDQDHQILGFQRQAALEIMIGKNVVEQKDHDAFVRSSSVGKDIAELVEAAPSEDELGHGFKISEHSGFSLFNLFSAIMIRPINPTNETAPTN